MQRRSKKIKKSGVVLPVIQPIRPMLNRDSTSALSDSQDDEFQQIQKLRNRVVQFAIPIAEALRWDR